MKFLSLEYDAFSLQINDSSVRIIKLIKKRGNFFISSFNEIKIKPGIVDGGVIKNERALAAVIKAACRKAKGKKLNAKYVIASLPEEESFLQVIQMPKMSEDELRSAIVFEAENYIPMPIDKVYFDFQVIAPVVDSIDHSDVLIVAMPQKIVDSYVSCIKKAGLIPIAFEAESQATVRALVKNETSNYPIILIDFSDDRPNFIIFSGNSVRLTSSASFLTQEDAASDKKKNAKPDAAEKLIAQIEKYADFYKEHACHEHIPSEGSVKKIILCGKEADLPKLADSISEKMGIEVEIGNPFINFPKQSEKYNCVTDPLRYTTALGLSLRNND